MSLSVETYLRPITVGNYLNFALYIFFILQLMKLLFELVIL